ncbi:hypothetical protein F5Y15DRAFT_157970 [Xylariaceae sp. FL0016]|nr:hypothetical protein F5Y15DRAFT_157970 [Xylariaceae sp. FL0016]
MAPRHDSNGISPTEVIEGIEPELNTLRFDPVEYGRLLQPGSQVDRDQNKEVDYEEGALETNIEHEGLELNLSQSAQHRPSIPISQLTELGNERQRDTSTDTDQLKPRRWHFPGPKVWIILGLFVLMIIGAVVGSVLGSEHHYHSKSPLSSSNLAVANWTLSDNTTLHVVANQDTDQSLIAYIGNANNWSQVNISQGFDNTGGLGVRHNSPLALAVFGNSSSGTNNSLTYELNLFYLTQGNEVVQIVTSDTTLTNWDWGDVGPHSQLNVPITTAPGSQLAAAWQQCHNVTACGPGILSLTYEDMQQNFVVANSSYDWRPIIASDRLAENSSLALISMNYNTSTTTDYLWGFFDTNGILGSAWEDFQNGNWWWTSEGRNVLYDVEPSSLQHFAAASFRDRMHAFMAALSPDGTVTGKHWDPDLNDWYPEALIKFLDGPTANFSTIAMTADARFYGIALDGITQEYEMDTTDPYTFHWLGQVS